MVPQKILKSLKLPEEKSVETTVTDEDRDVARSIILSIYHER